MNPTTKLPSSLEQPKERIVSRKNKSFKEIIYKTFIYLLLILISLIMIFPFYWLIRSALMTQVEVFTMPVKWLPSIPQWSNFKEALTSAPFGLYFKNTIFLVVLNVFGALLSNSFIAFGFARISFKTRNFWFGFVLMTLMLPGAVMLIPQFVGWKVVGAYNTYFPLILPAFFGNAFNIFLLKQFYSTIPIEYDEAAKVEGANYLQIWYKIILPLSKPALVTIGVFTFLSVWNDFMGPLLYLNDESKWTLALGLQSFQGHYSSQWNLLMAAAVVMFAPLVILFFFAQKQIMSGANLTGGIKG
ncbi:sugar ABC transporter permease [Pullulanibacillus camelliae]|uniref:Sugar ABC transporter permease n=2 Tax=Pullulanibacillus camelliae TaxID=1707096 RepID=A0A8J2YE92_9BACL|nr:sugar ABC transporter permease [Pullulanibacillus camelliae]